MDSLKSSVKFISGKGIFLSLIVAMSIFFTIGFKEVSAMSLTESTLGTLIDKYGEENSIVENGLSLNMGEVYSLNNESYVVEAQGKVQWSSLNSNIAYVSNGSIRAVSPGNTFIVGQVGSEYRIIEVWVKSQNMRILSSIQGVSSGKSYYKVFIDPGHGGKDPGAVRNGVRESDVNLATALKVQAKLKAKGVDIMISRTTDVFVELKERSIMANNYGADVFVSIHYNAAGTSTVKGIETYYHENKPAHYTYASKVHTGLINNTGAVNRGVRTADYSVTRESNMAAVLVEGGYLTNVSEAALVNTDAYQEKIANGIVDGVMAYLTQNIPLYTWVYENENWYYVNKLTGEKSIGWVNDASQWYYLDETGARQTGWVTVGGSRYFLNDLGVMQTGWLTYENKRYYLNPSGAMTTGIIKDSGKIYLLHEDGTLQTGLYTYGGKTYYFKEDGLAQIGFITLEGKLYCFDKEGAMTTGFIVDNGTIYYLHSDGILQKGWFTIDGKTYFFKADGTAYKGLLTEGSKVYYFNSNGVKTTGWISIGGSWYFIDSNDVGRTGWLLNDGKWYYLDRNGARQSGWILSGSKWYYLAGNGVMQTGWVQLGGYWYYLDGSGAMKTGWIVDGGKWYYLYSDGRMARSTTIGGYRLDSSGAWVQ